MTCRHCDQEATVHLAETVDDQSREVHLCARCARKAGVLVSQPPPELGLDAVVQTGFFYLADHGITPEEVDLLFSQSAEFFLHEPEAERVKRQDRNNNTGYTAMQQEQLDTTSRAGGDLKESFYLAGLSRIPAR